MVDANSVVTRYEYDALNRLSAVVENYVSGGGSDNQTNVRTVYGYDPLGNRTPGSRMDWGTRRLLRMTR